MSGAARYGRLVFGHVRLVGTGKQFYFNLHITLSYSWYLCHLKWSSNKAKDFFKVSTQNVCQA